MKLLAIHTVPLWQEPDGTQTLGFNHRPDHPPVIGWCNAALIIINNESRWFLLVLNNERE